MSNCGALDNCRKQALGYLNGAKNTIAKYPESEARKMLEELLEYMAKNGVQLLRYYQDNFEHSIFGPSVARTPVTDRFQKQSVCITTDPYLTDAEYVFMAEKIKEFLV
mgnify:CR=1 FL=1